ncbi:hypothetical protein BC829DRAFT_107279 [Chytridium lagenaria]|nr:hypothetical protein BC829DRAFT_107279 [Chytridium lagenaria]
MYKDLEELWASQSQSSHSTTTMFNNKFSAVWDDGRHTRSSSNPKMEVNAGNGNGRPRARSQPPMERNYIISECNQEMYCAERGSRSSSRQSHSSNYEVNDIMDSLYHPDPIRRKDEALTSFRKTAFVMRTKMLRLSQMGLETKDHRLLVRHKLVYISDTMKQIMMGIWTTAMLAALNG